MQLLTMGQQQTYHRFADRLRARVMVTQQLAAAEIRSFLQPDQSPLAMAFAFAIGTLLSFIPAPFIDSILVGVVLAKFKQINKVALLGARAIWNDLIVVPLYWKGYSLGTFLIEPYAADNTAILSRFIAFTLGTLLFAILAALSGAILVAAFFLLRRQLQVAANRGGARRLAPGCRHRP